MITYFLVLKPSLFGDGSTVAGVLTGCLFNLRTPIFHYIASLRPYFYYIACFVRTQIKKVFHFQEQYNFIYDLFFKNPFHM